MFSLFLIWKYLFVFISNFWKTKLKVTFFFIINNKAIIIFFKLKINKKNQIYPHILKNIHKTSYENFLNLQKNRELWM